MVRVRIKFEKTGCMKFIGHLDVMRYFQKVLRRADIPVVLSEGFSPHMQMSFASPLGVGKTSSGEYFDVDLQEPVSSEELVRRMNEQMVDGMLVLSAKQVPADKANKCMTLTAAASYTVFLDPDRISVPENLGGLTEDFLSQREITVMRKTKRKEELTDIRPWIFSLAAQDASLEMLLSSGSVHNLKPELVMEALASYGSFELPEYSFRIHRNEIYADRGTDGEVRLVPLEELGEEIV